MEQQIVLVDPQSTNRIEDGGPLGCLVLSARIRPLELFLRHVLQVSARVKSKGEGGLLPKTPHGDGVGDARLDFLWNVLLNEKLDRDSIIVDEYRLRGRSDV
jgi:hypothetical protein